MFFRPIHHRGTEHTKSAQRKPGISYLNSSVTKLLSELIRAKQYNHALFARYPQANDSLCRLKFPAAARETQTRPKLATLDTAQPKPACRIPYATNLPCAARARPQRTSIR